MDRSDKRSEGFGVAIKMQAQVRNYEEGEEQNGEMR
jgi:hypothetical protein